MGGGGGGGGRKGAEREDIAELDHAAGKRQEEGRKE